MLQQTAPFVDPAMPILVLAPYQLIVPNADIPVVGLGHEVEEVPLHVSTEGLLAVSSSWKPVPVSRSVPLSTTFVLVARGHEAVGIRDQLHVSTADSPLLLHSSGWIPVSKSVFPPRQTQVLVEDVNTHRPSTFALSAPLLVHPTLLVSTCYRMIRLPV